MFEHIEVRADGSKDKNLSPSEHDPHIVNEEKVAKLHKHVIPPQRKDVTPINPHKASKLLIINLPPT